MPTRLDRRRFLQGAAFGGTAAALAACTNGASATAVPTSAPSDVAPSAPPEAGASVTSPNPTPDSAATVLVDDVVEFELRGPYEWNGGSVTMKLREGRLDGEPIYFVRTDASDQAFAKEAGLVWVPVLGLAAEEEGGAGRIFLFAGDAAESQVSILSTGPGREDFTPLYRVNRVTFRGEPTVLDSAGAVDGSVDVVYVSLDVDPNERPGDLEDYVPRQGFTWRFAVAPPEMSRSLAATFGDQILSPPATPVVLLGPDGSVIEVHTGIKSAGDLAALIEAHLP